MKHVFLFGVAGLAMACAAAIHPVPYHAQPERISDPAAEVRALILANTVQGCVTEPELNAEMLTVKFVCSNGVGNAVIRFPRVQSVALDESGGWYRVRVLHLPGTEPFQWTSKSLDDMTRLADAITALTQAAKPTG